MPQDQEPSTPHDSIVRGWDSEKIAARGRTIVRARSLAIRGKIMKDSAPETTLIRRDKIVKEWDPVRVEKDKAPGKVPIHHDKIAVDGDPGQPPLRPDKIVTERGRTNSSAHHSKTDQVNNNPL